MTHRTGIVVFDGMTLLDASGPAEVFHLAQWPGGPYRVEFLSAAGGPVRSTSGVTVDSTAAAQTPLHLDTVLVAGGPALATDPLDPDLLQTVRLLSEGAARVASVCTGAFVLAELGFLDGRRAATHWRHAAALARLHPRVTVEPDVIHIRDGRFLTSAGISAGIDLALALVEEDAGAAAARAVAQELVMLMQRPGGQTQFSAALSGPVPQSGALREVMESVQADPTAQHTVSALASRAGLSVRHLTRLFREQTGTTPSQWVERVRVDAARALILDGHPVTRAAQRSGFGSDETLRRAFARQLGTTPTAFRERFATTASTGHGP